MEGCRVLGLPTIKGMGCPVAGDLVRVLDVPRRHRQPTQEMGGAEVVGMYPSRRWRCYWPGPLGQRGAGATEKEER